MASYLHFKQVCEFGSVHSQCRCPSPDKEIRTIKCNIPNIHHTQMIEDLEEPADIEKKEKGTYSLIVENIRHRDLTWEKGLAFLADEAKRDIKAVLFDTTGIPIAATIEEGVIRLYK